MTFQTEKYESAVHSVRNPTMVNVRPIHFRSGITSEPRLASVAGVVIQAVGRSEVEDGLWMGVHLEDSWCPSRVHTNPVHRGAF